MHFFKDLQSLKKKKTWRVLSQQADVVVSNEILYLELRVLSELSHPGIPLMDIVRKSSIGS